MRVALLLFVLVSTSPAFAQKQCIAFQPNGLVEYMPHGQSWTYFRAPIARAPQQCEGATRFCSNGSLSGNHFYEYTSCRTDAAETATAPSFSNYASLVYIAVALLTVITFFIVLVSRSKALPQPSPQTADTRASSPVTMNQPQEIIVVSPVARPRHDSKMDEYARNVAMEASMQRVHSQPIETPQVVNRSASYDEPFLNSRRSGNNKIDGVQSRYPSTPTFPDAIVITPPIVTNIGFWGVCLSIVYFVFCVSRLDIKWNEWRIILPCLIGPGEPCTMFQVFTQASGYPAYQYLGLWAAGILIIVGYVWSMAVRKS